MKHRNEPPPDGYGNIYTPHAGSMIIQVQREGGLANRTIVLGKRQVAALRFLTSRSGKLFLVIAAVTWLLLALQAVRTVPLVSEIKRYKADAHRLDSLEVTLTQLQRNYEQLHNMLGATAAPSTTTGQSAPPPTSTKPDTTNLVIPPDTTPSTHR